jgi:hypothetical protein
MVVVHRIAARDELQAAAGMLGKCVQHVVEKRDVGCDLDRTAVEAQTQVDLSLGGGAFDRRVTIVQLSTPFGVAAWCDAGA